MLSLYSLTVISATMFYSFYISKTVKIQFCCIIMRRYFSRMQKDNGSGRALGLDPFLETVYVFYFLLAFYFTILILYTTDFNPRINKDIIIIIIIIIITIIIIIMLSCQVPISERTFTL